jgi:hypothetical protein
MTALLSAFPRAARRAFGAGTLGPAALGALAGVAALLAGCGAFVTAPAVPASTVATAQAASSTLLAQGQDISGRALHEPACRSGCALSGDATSILYAMAWRDWTNTEAVGAGTENIESCVPDCATGGQYRVPVVVTFSQRVRACAARSGTGHAAGSGVRWFWSEAAFSYPRGLPRALQGARKPANPWRFTGLIAQARASCR